MKKLKLSILALAGILFGCQQAEMLDPNEVGGQPMKSVTISTEVTGVDTKASLDSETGQFSWQSGDVISVLATDGKFYDFTLKEGEGNWKAVFRGSIPETAEITTVATYPSFVASGTENTVLTENTLNYVLPTEWTWKKDASNVPMVAAFGEAATSMSFKQVGGVMRFPVINMPAKGTFKLTMTGIRITGEFPVDITNLGEAAMVADSGLPVVPEEPGTEEPGTEEPGTEEPGTEEPGTEEPGTEEPAPAEAEVYTETMTIHYSSAIDGDNVDINIPVPTGVYNNFKLEILDENGDALFEKNYVLDNVVERATLLLMSPVEFPARSMAAPVVWPYFVDARVVIPTAEEGDQYAVYVDGAEEPVIKDVEMVSGKATVSFGGDFAHNSTHTVVVAKVYNGVILTTTKSAAAEFTTADVRQLTTNTGTQFVSVGWDDVAIDNGPKFLNGKWTPVQAANYPDLDEQGRKLHQTRGYEVQLLADDKTTVIYDMIPFDGHSVHQNAFYDAAAMGRINGGNILTPTALTFGYLEPGKDYYFRVKTIDGVKEIAFEDGDYIAEGNTDKPYPYPLSSARGGSAWSELVKVSTDPEHVKASNEVLYQGFDSVMLGSDYMNWAAAVNPDMETTKRQGWDSYILDTPAGYPAFLQKAESDRKWTTHTFNKFFRADYLGWYDGSFVGGTYNVLNNNAGDLAGWQVNTSKVERNIWPIFGAIAMGQDITSHGGSTLSTPPLTENLLSDRATECKVTVKVAYMTQNRARVSRILHVYNTRTPDAKEILDVSQTYPQEWAEVEERLVENNTKDYKSDNYIHYQRYYELECKMYLRKGDVITFEKITGSGSDANQTKEYGFIVIGEIKVEADFSKIEEPTFDDSGVGTEPDETNYDVYGLGEFPVSHWYTVEPWAYTNPDGTYNDELTKQRYQEMKDAGINTTIYYGHELNYSIAEQKRILGICEEIGLNFMGMCPEEGNIDNIPEIKSQLASSKYYLGHYISDEPSAAKFDKLGQYTKAFLEAIPEKDVYVNLYPMYAKTNSLGTSTYEQHIDQYLEKVPTKALSFDYYPFFKNGIGDNFFTNMDLVRSKTLARRMPYWMITQAGKVNENLLPTEKQERWSVWAAIALGSKGISYFCYWTPSGENFNDTPYMIDIEGNKTDFYYVVQRLNADIKTIGKKLLPCHADGAIMTATRYYPLFDNGGTGRTNYGPVKEVTGSQSILCGCFRDARVSENGENYKGYKTLVMSQMPDRTVDAYLTLDPSVSEITITHNNTTQTVQVSNTLSTVVGGVVVSFDGAKLTLGIPEGDAALIEF